MGVRGEACSGQIFISEEACGGPEWGRVVHGVRWGSGGWGSVSGISSPLSGTPSSLSGIPAPYLVSQSAIWYPIILSVMPSPQSGIPSPMWYPIPLMSHQSGILHSMIFQKFEVLKWMPQGWCTKFC